MAFFGKKKDNGDSKDPKDGQPGGGTPGPDKGAGGSKPGQPKYTVQADLANKWFERAKTVHESTNYEYAMQCWLSGLRLDPTNLSALEHFFDSSRGYLGETGEKGAAKEVRKEFSGRTEVDRFLSAVLEWALKPRDAESAVRAGEAAVKVELTEQAYWICERAMNVVAMEKKPRKDLYLRLMDSFSKIGGFDQAVVAGQAAVRLDPMDGKLAAEVRNLAAQATMSKGGYDQTGQAGGFRANIRDADKQRHLEEAERIVKTDETIDRLLVVAHEDYKQRPEDPSTINVYAKRLLERGRPEDEERAYKVLTKGFETSKQFRFRQMAGDIKLRRAERKVLEYKDAADAAPADQTASEAFRRATVAFLKMQVEEYKSRVEAYPTDLGLKFELGMQYFKLGQYEDAIPLFQESQNDSKRRVESLSYLAQAFQRHTYTDEAIHTYRQALEVHKVHSDELGMELRYGLLTSLQTRAEAERDLAAAEEADKLASGIAIQQFNYRDVRARRDALKKLIAELKRGDAA